MRELPRDMADLERIAGVKRSVPVTHTQRDVEHLTIKRLQRWPAWRRKLRRG